MAFLQAGYITETDKKRSYPLIDICKLVCAILVVIIHCNPFGQSSQMAELLLSNGLCRIAVPLFYTISAFFLFRKLKYPLREYDRQNIKIVLRYWVHIFKIYLLWSIIYILIQIPQWMEFQFGGIALIKEEFLLFGFKGTYYHLWFLLAMLYAVKLNYVLVIPLVAYYLLNCLLTTTIKIKNKEVILFCRNASIAIYCVHPAFIFICDKKRWM